MPNYATFPGIDFEGAETAFSPPEAGEGNWIGAPCVHRHDGTTYLALRRRTPERRGYAVAIYERRAGGFEERVEMTAEELGVVSVERPALVTDPRSGRLKLYLSVDHDANDWTIQKLDDATTVEGFDPATARDVLEPRPGTSDGVTVKDPFVLVVGGRYYMYYAGHDGQSEQAHVATSVDGEDWTRPRTGPVIPRQHWHDHHTRISCAIPARDAPVWLVFYEGSARADYGETWNLRTAFAVSHALETVLDASPDGPRIAAPTADGVGVDRFATCRYLDVLDHGDEWEVFAEVAREDGAFDLRRTTVSPPRTTDPRSDRH